MSAEVVAYLHPPRLPEAFTAAGLPDALLALGLGLLVALLVHAALAPLSHRKAKPVPLPAALKALEGMPEGDALLRLAELAQARGMPLTPSEREALYKPPSPQIVSDLAQRLRRQGGRR